MNLKRTMTVFTLAASAAAVVCVAGPASAAEGCPSGQVCLYYNSNDMGSYEHWSDHGQFDLSNYTFSNWGDGSGYGETVYDNAASVYNNTGEDIYIWSTADQAWGDIPPGYAGTLPLSNPDLYNKDGVLYIP
jgi:hypothetical protein